MRLGVTSQYFHESCLLYECERHYCPRHRLLWRDCDSAVWGVEGDLDEPHAWREVYELRGCPTCERTVPKWEDNMTALTLERRAELVARFEARPDMMGRFFTPTPAMKPAATADAVVRARADGLDVAAMGIPRPIYAKVRQLRPLYDNACINAFLEAWI